MQYAYRGVWNITAQEMLTINITITVKYIVEKYIVVIVVDAELKSMRRNRAG